MDPCIPTLGSGTSTVLVVAAIVLLVGIAVLLIGRARPAALLLIALISVGGVLAADSSTASASADCPTTTTSSTTTTTEVPVAPVAVSQTVQTSSDVSGSLIDDGDTLGSPTATITNLNAPAGPGAVAVGTATAIDDTDGRPCGTITIAADGSYAFTPTLQPAPHQCSIEYTLTNIAGSSTATEEFLVAAAP